MFLKTRTANCGVPLHPRVRAVLANLPHRDGEVFRRPDGRPYARHSGEPRGASDGIRKAFSGACRRAGIKDFSAHDCGHTWATWHYAQNRDLLASNGSAAGKPYGDARYAHINTAELAHTIDKLPWAETGGLLGDSASEKAKSA
jgi:integrase